MQKVGLFVCFADPSLPASETPVFWSSKDYAYVLDTLLASHVDSWEARFRLDEFSQNCFVLKTKGCETYVLLRKGNESVQLIFREGKHPELSDYVRLEISSFDGLKQKLSSLNRLQNWYLELSNKPDVSQEKTTKLHDQLCALKAWQAGKSYRQIAQELFGKRRVKSDWQGDSPALKGRVRRLVKRGRYLMNGGYRDLLK